ncbi:family 4 glycosyl hydrolase [Phytohabitans rumicis]|uniref:family 4 glycosyl hydrolase n=1 Tax=Phytohabitans rumicis TaxID=1076125 RepID=UPI003530AC66
MHRALLVEQGEPRVTDLVLYDVDLRRLTAIRHVLEQQATLEGDREPLNVSVTTDLKEALAGADFVFSAIRVGGLEGRVVDEQVALDQGVLGQETVGAGGISYGLRTVPVAIEVARRIAELAPDAWTINFTNPAGMVTEAMAAHLGDRVIGICDSPVGLTRRVARLLGLDPATAWFDYAGLNHLGWLRGVYVEGHDHLPRLMANAEALGSFEEGKLFGAEWLQTLGSVPNEYLYYYYYSHEAIRAGRAAALTRGAFLLRQQQDFYAQTERDAGSALAAWRRTRAEREATYMADTREIAGAGDRDSDDMESGGYEQVALSIMRAIARDERTVLILNVRNRAALSVVDEDAVVEVPCVVDANGPHQVVINQLPAHAAGLVASVKAVERAAIEAAVEGSRRAALKALALHPLVGSVTVAQRMLDQYVQQFPQLSYLRG